MKGAFAEELTRTPAQTEGPFYPTSCRSTPTTTCSSSTTSITPAVGEITHLTGKILDAKGNPVRNAVVEIWQCDANGVYLHTDDSDGKKDKQDKNFQGFGRFLTGIDRRVLLPHDQAGAVPRPHAAHPLQGQEGPQGAADHAVYIKGHPGNEKDGIWTRRCRTRSSATRSRSTSRRSRSRRSASWPRTSTSCWA